MLQVRQDVLGERFQLQRAAFERQPFPDLSVRKDRLKRLLALTERHEADICAAIDADFGGRSAHETRLAELFVVRAGIRHTLSHLKGWMRERRVATTLPFLPGHNRLIRSRSASSASSRPWNYPFQLALAPAAAALAAGNRVHDQAVRIDAALLGELLAEMVGERFKPGGGGGRQGDAAVGAAFVVAAVRSSALHRLDRGRPARREAAAANLTPVTLELGGKSPAIVDPSADLDAGGGAASPTASCFNAGQTCIAPDYLLVPRAARSSRSSRRCKQRVRAALPDARDNPDYTSIINDAALPAPARPASTRHARRGARVVAARPTRRRPPIRGARAARRPCCVDADRRLTADARGDLRPAAADRATYDTSTRRSATSTRASGRSRSTGSATTAATRDKRAGARPIAGGVTINDDAAFRAGEPAVRRRRRQRHGRLSRRGGFRTSPRRSRCSSSRG